MLTASRTRDWTWPGRWEYDADDDNEDGLWTDVRCMKTMLTSMLLTGLCLLADSCSTVPEGWAAPVPWEDGVDHSAGPETNHAEARHVKGPVVYVLGYVKRPDVYQLEPGLTVEAAIALAAGLVRGGKLEFTHVLGEGAVGDIKPVFLATKRARQRTLVQGDTVIVGSSDKSRLSVFTTRPPY